jgi:hypothetical protein
MIGQYELMNVPVIFLSTLLQKRGGTEKLFRFINDRYMSCAF